MPDETRTPATVGEQPPPDPKESVATPQSRSGIYVPAPQISVHRRGLDWRRGLTEFVIIFAGVTLSLLADDWRDRRNARSGELEALTLILADLRADSVQLARVLEPLPLHDMSAEWITSNWHREMQRDSLQSALGAFQAAYPYQIPRTAFASLRDGGGLGLIDGVLRHAIVNYYEASQVQVSQWLEFHWSEREALWDVLWPYVTMPPGLNRGSMLPSVPDPPQLQMTWNQLSQDYRAYNQIGQVGVAANVAAAAIRGALEENRLLRAAVASKLRTND